MFQGFIFSTSLPTLTCSFDNSHSDEYGLIRVIVLLIFIFLVTTDVDHLFRCLLAIYMSLGKCLIGSSAHFFKFLGFFFLMLSYMSSLYTLDINPLSDISFASIFFKTEYIWLKKVHSCLTTTQLFHFDAVVLLVFLNVFFQGFSIHI